MTKEINCPECGAIISSDLMSADPQRRRFFAIIRDIHANLRPEHRHRFPGAETLRKHALIAAGHCDVMTVTAGSKTAAPEVAAAFQRMDRYCIVDIQGTVLTVFTARSMSRTNLLRPQFHEISEKVFAWIEEQTGIDGSRSEAA